MINGYLLVVNEKFEPHAKTQFSKSGAPITCIAFNFDLNNKSSMCAVGGADGFVKIYDIKSKFKKFTMIKKSNSAITHIDFIKLNMNNQIPWALQVSNANGEVHYFNATPDSQLQGKVLSDLSLLREATW